MMDDNDAGSPNGRCSISNNPKNRLWLYVYNSLETHFFGGGSNMTPLYLGLKIIRGYKRMFSAASSLAWGRSWPM